MKTSQPGLGQKNDSQAEREKARRAQDRTPPPTGASRGSPVAPVMKQSAKTKAESSGGS